MDIPKDYLGNPINVGDLIAWASQSGDSPCLCRGVVTNIKQAEDWRGNPTLKIQAKRKANSKYEQDGRIVTLAHLDRIIVIPNKAGEVTDEDSGQ
jgi:hypothetical protein